MTKKYLRIDCSSIGGASMMTGIQVEINDGDSFEVSKAKALGYIVEELARYGLDEALRGIGLKPTAEHTVLINGDYYRRV